MTVRLGLLVTLEAKPGRGNDLAAFLESGLALAQAEELTVNWYAFRLGENTYGIFDTFEGEEGRQAHLGGEIAAALGQVAGDLLAAEPDVRPVDVIAAK
jgi:quinol monooxygenase YgiN